MLDGPAISIIPAVVQGIGMAMQELATNALKYGALSAEGGRIVVRWRLERRRDEAVFYIDWKESGGPHVATPARSGFGSTIIRDMASYAVGGEAQISYAPQGVWWRLEAPAGVVLLPD